ncbi:MAG TPA: lipoprotein insertase outer membrane protein LolB [Steroidobacteraceae bacterium]
MTRAALALLAGLLAGCAGLPKVAPHAPSTAGLAALSAWVASGRLAVAANGEGGSGGFVWQQQGAETRLRISGPLGAGALEIASDGEALSVVDGAGRALGPEAHAVLRARLGTDLPLTSFRYWMVGVPDPATAARVTEAVSTPQRVIDQHGWTISYDAFEPSHGLELPTRVTATTGAVRLRMIVNDWQIVPKSGSEPNSPAAADSGSEPDLPESK